MNTDDLSPADDLVGDTAQRLFADHVDKGVRERAERGELDAALWARVQDAGFPLLLATEAAGGFAQSWRTAFPVLRGLGHGMVPLPLAETMVAALLGSLAGLALPEGPLTLIEQAAAPGLRAEGGAQPRLHGTVHAVPWARHARAALVSLQDGRLGWLDLAAPGVRITPHANHAGLPADSIALEQVALTAVADGPLALERPVWTLGAIARSAMMVGALEFTLEQAVRYAGERVQFGKPIGRNQAIQQNLALMAGDVAAARVAALVAADDAPDAQRRDTGATAFSAAVAKVRAGEAATRGTGIAHQVHGAIGFTHEHALHFATRRLWAWREEFGTDADWAAELGRAAIAARGAGFWPALTRKRFGPVPPSSTPMSHDLPDHPDVGIALDDRVATVELRKPPHNYFDIALIGHLADAFEALEADRRCHAIVLAAQGTAFCAGADFSKRDATPPQRSPRGVNPLYGEALRLFACSKPVVAAVHGPAVGGGLGLALVADFRVTCPEARFSANFNRLGFHPGFGLSVTLPRLVGEQQAALLFYTGRRIGGEAAHAIGLADVLVPQDQVRAEASRLAHEIAVSAPIAVQSTRATLRQGLVERLRVAVARESEQQNAHFATADFREGVAAMAARREPRFQGE